MRRRELLGLVGSVVAFASAAGSSTANSESLPNAAEGALNGWADALFSGDPAQVDRVLAPQFQLIRANGEGFTREDYLNNLPSQNKRIEWSDVVATGDQSTLVLRYRAEVDQVIDGKVTTGTAPRLSVFLRDGDRWLILAHANFSGTV